MKDKRWVLGILSFVVIAVIVKGTMAGVEPSPFKQAFEPLVKEFRFEIVKAHDKLKRFELTREMDLKKVTYACKSIPAMQNLVEEMSAKAGIIGDTGMRSKMHGYIQSLRDILAIQQNNRTDKVSAQKALNEMGDILDKMEDLIK